MLLKSIWLDSFDLGKTHVASITEFSGRNYTSHIRKEGPTSEGYEIPAKLLRRNNGGLLEIPTPYGVNS